MITAPDACTDETATEKAAGPRTSRRSPLAQLLHALNQPLTGLQCSMEVAMAAPRTAAQYVHGLREGLELTERMRRLVAAIREVVDGEADVEEETIGQLGSAELERLLQDAVRDFAPVAEGKGVRIALDCSSPDHTAQDRSSLERASANSMAVKWREPLMATILFRLLDSILSVAARGTGLQIATESGPDWICMRFEWQAQAACNESSAAEVGLLVAQARLEGAGAEWTREAKADLETLTIRLPRGSSRAGIHQSS